MKEQRTLRIRWMRWRLRHRQDFKCAICGETIGKSFHADHVKAWVKGGKTNTADMQALCSDCNLKKGDRDV